MYFTAACLIVALCVQLVVSSHFERRFTQFTVKITKKNEVVCAGTLLSTRFFLTLEECFDVNKLDMYEVLIGKNTRRAIAHVQKGSKGKGMVIGRLSSTVTYKGDNIDKIRLYADDDMIEVARRDGVRKITSGVNGKGNNVIVRTTIEPDNPCKSKANLCVQEAPKEAELCSLLPGAPVLALIRKRWTMIGILKPRLCGTASMAVNIARHQEWILEDINLQKSTKWCKVNTQCSTTRICQKNKCVCKFCFREVDGECIETRRDKILILGAGMAGSAAAYELSQNGCQNIEIIEGSDEVGGRVKSGDLGNHTVELGAQWLYGLGRNPIYRLAQQYGLSVRTDVEFLWTVRDRNGEDLSGLADSEYNRYFKALGRVRRFNEKMRDRGSADISVEGLLRHFGWSPESKVSSAVELYTLDFETGKESSAVSGKYYGQYDSFDEHNDNNWALLSDGMGAYTIIERLLLDVIPEGDDRISFNKVVTKIEDWDKEIVKVHTADGSIYEGNRIIVTFSIGVLQSRNVVFDPPLPQSALLAIDAYGMGNLEYVYFEFPETFWDDTFTILYASEKHGYFTLWENLNVLYPGRNVLQLHLTGDEAKGFVRMDDEQVKEKALEILGEMYPNASIPEPLAMVRTNWQSDPLTAGAYSYWPTGFSSETYNALRKPLGNMFFAGEAFAKRS